MELEIIFENEHFVAINKPHGLLVHRSKIANNTNEFAIQILRDQIGQRINLCHRLDRKTSGVLLFAKDKVSTAMVQNEFALRNTRKTYKAIVRGYIVDEGVIDYPIAEDDKPLQDAISNFRCLERFELALPQGKFMTSRYSLVEMVPETGRFHQLRKHLSHIRHPIIGDRPHGCNKQNRLWKNHFDMHTMLLHAESLSFTDPNLDFLNLKAVMSKEFADVLTMLRTNTILGHI